MRKVRVSSVFLSFPLCVLHVAITHGVGPVARERSGLPIIAAPSTLCLKYKEGGPPHRPQGSLGGAHRGFRKDWDTVSSI